MKVLITGHTSGIGKSLARIYLENQNEVYGISRTFSDDFPEENQLKLDLSISKGLPFVSNWLESKEIDIFVHCAGSNPIVSIFDSEIDDYISCFNLHTLSAIEIFKFIMPRMKKKKSGKVFLISSIWSEINADSRGPYSLAKAALNSFARQIAVEHGEDGINSLSIILGFVETPLSAKTKSDKRISIAKSRLVSTNNSIVDSLKIAKIIYDISLTSCIYMNGSSLYLDGGILSR